jgi:hypothetical protein
MRLIIIALTMGFALGNTAVSQAQAGCGIRHDEHVHAAVKSLSSAPAQGAKLGARQADRGEGTRCVVYALDISSSMRTGNKIDKAKEALKKALGELRRSDTFNIIFFKRNATTFRDDVVPATQANVTNAKVFVDQIRTGDGTNISAAMDLALGMTGISYIYLMANSEPNSGLTDFGELRRYIREKNTHGVKIMTLAIGLGEKFAGVRLLKGIAGDNHGMYDYIDLSKIASSSTNHQGELSKARRNRVRQ